MRQILLGLMTIIIFSFVLVAFVVALTFYQDYSTKQYVQSYYDDIIRGDYDKAYEHVHPWSGNPDSVLGVTAQEARDNYLKKVSRLQDENYKVVSVDNIVVREDGSKLGAEVTLTISIKGEQKKIKELIHFYNAKIVIVQSQDPYAYLRDGRLDD